MTEIHHHKMYLLTETSRIHLGCKALLLGLIPHTEIRIKALLAMKKNF